MIFIKKNIIVLMFLIGGVNLLSGMIKTDEIKKFREFDQSIILKSYDKKGVIKFVKLEMFKECVHCIIDADGDPVFFATAIQYYPNDPEELAYLRVYGRNAKTLVNIFTEGGNNPLLPQNNVDLSCPEFYSDLEELRPEEECSVADIFDVFGCDNGPMYCFLHIKGEDVDVDCKALDDNKTTDDLWNIFYKMIRICAALKAEKTGPGHPVYAAISSVTSNDSSMSNFIMTRHFNLFIKNIISRSASEH